MNAGFEDSMVDVGSTFGASTIVLPDVDALEGGRPLRRFGGHDNDASGRAGGGEPSGRNHPTESLPASRLPGKPTASQKHNIDLMTGGPDSKHLRDRDSPVSKKAPKDRQKLPAPKPGDVTGHGLNSPSGSIASGSVSKQRGGGGGGDYGSINQLQQGSITKQRKDILF